MEHSACFINLVDDVKAHIKEVSIDDVAAMQQRNENFLLIDVREESEWQKGHIKNAVHLSKGIIERDVEKKVPDKNAKLVLYCGGGSRSALTADNLQKMGYTNVYSMAGGWRGWSAKDLPRE